MGGAFVGVADDANATYWNPAGLVRLRGTSVASMHTSANRDDINYQEYLAVGIPTGPSAAVGFSWIRYNLSLAGSGGGSGLFRARQFGTGLTDQEDWYWLSLAYGIAPDTSVGVSMKYVSDSIPGLDTDMAVDVGVFHEMSSKWAFGLLVQDFNEPALRGAGAGERLTWARNWRPGFSWRPRRGTILSTEIYDATDNADCRSLRIGYEKWIASKLALRAGYYGIGAKANRALTFGIGLVTPKPPSTGLDVAVMIGDINTVLTSVTTKF